MASINREEKKFNSVKIGGSRYTQPWKFLECKCIALQEKNGSFDEREAGSSLVFVWLRFF